MPQQIVQYIDNLQDLRENLSVIARDFEYSCILDSNSDSHLFTEKNAFSKFDIIAGFARQSHTRIISDIKELEEFQGKQENWYLGFFTYDLKNAIEKLHSKNNDHMGWPTLMFFSPEILILVKNNRLELTIAPSFDRSYKILERLNYQHIFQKGDLPSNLRPRFSKTEYLSRVKHIQELIHRGDIYETNFCQEFFSYSNFDPYSGFIDLNKNLPSPFSAFFRKDRKYLLCASPERFLCKQGDLLISQPIKGTVRRGTSPEEDKVLKSKLSNSLKERSENVMIVDLVRNDLSKIAQPGSVKVSELCGIYTFPRVHQMISTVEAKPKKHSLAEIIRATFPMGSMTGAPKIEAMRIIDRFEIVRRGLYSGSVGYMDPDGNFDFNVVIRSLQYNADNQYLSYFAGSAITALSDPENEYEECLLKVYGMNESLQKADYA